MVDIRLGVTSRVRFFIVLWLIKMIEVLVCHLIRGGGQFVVSYQKVLVCHLIQRWGSVCGELSKERQHIIYQNKAGHLCRVFYFRSV